MKDRKKPKDFDGKKLKGVPLEESSIKIYVPEGVRVRPSTSKCGKNEKEEPKLEVFNGPKEYDLKGKKLKHTLSENSSMLAKKVTKKSLGDEKFTIK